MVKTLIEHLLARKSLAEICSGDLIAVNSIIHFTFNPMRSTQARPLAAFFLR